MKIFIPNIYEGYRESLGDVMNENSDVNYLPQCGFLK
jgi:hypothetical protein